MRIRDTDTGSILRKFEPNSALRTFAVSPSEKWLAISQNRRVSLVEVASGKLIHECNGHDTYISQVAFLDDGERLLSSGDNAPILWTLKPQNLPIIPALDDHLWEKLAGDDAAEIYQLQWALLGDSKRTIEWLAKQVKPGIWMNKKEFDALATDLDSIRFAVREKAEAALIVKNHEIPLNWLKQVRTSSEEVNSRIERIRKARPTGPAPRELLRLERALHLLELANSAEAKTLLKAWSNQSPETQLTHEAKLSWERLIERENKSTDKSDWIKRVEKTKKP